VPTKVYSVIVDFAKIHPVKAVLCLGSSWVCVRDSQINCPICVKFGITDLHIMLVSICELRENRRREGCAFVVGVNEITCTGVPWNLWYFESKEHLGEIFNTGCCTSVQQLPYTPENSRWRTNHLKSILCPLLQVLDVADFCSINSRRQMSP
jgi:hypothetical protein